MIKRILILMFLMSTICLAQSITWEQVNNGPYGDYINSLFVATDGAKYASTRFGVYRTTDDGMRWSRVLTIPDVSCLASDSSGCFFAGIRWSPALYRSCDNGNQWTDTNIPFEGYGPNCIAVSPTGVVYAGKRFGLIFRSTDHGESWTRLSMGFDVTIRTMAVTSSGVVFAGTLGLGIYRSTDNGQWWQPVNSGLPIYTDVVAALAVNHQTNSIVAGFESSRVFLSTDNGSTWVGAGQPSTLLTSVVADDDGNLFVGTYGNGIYCSSNKGTSWRQFNDGLQGFDLYLSSIAGHSGRIYAGTYHGRVVESNGSEPWHSAETGISSPPVLNIESLQGDEIFVGAMGDVFRSTNIGESWETVSPRRDSTFVSAMKSLGGSRIIIGTENGDVFLSTDRGSSWTVAGNGLPRLAISCFALEPGGALYSSIGSYGIFRSTDFGGTWQRLGTSGLYPYVNAIEINAAGNIFAGSWQGIFLSTDKGSTWVQKDRGITYPSIYSLASNPNGTMIAGTTSSGIYRSTDNAESWIQTGSTGRSAYRLKYSNGLFFAATLDSGVYFSRDEGTTWQRISTGLDAGELRALGVDSLGFLWTSVYPYGGVYRTRTPLVTSIETSTSIQPSAFSLNQNYPNPFNPTTEIKYLIPEIRSQRSEVGHVTLKVYDLLGREVATLVNELQQPGAHSVRFDAVNLSSGVYLYRLVAGGYIQTRKMIVAK